MGKIIYTHLVVNTDSTIFKIQLEEAILKYQRFGKIELQYQTTPYYKDGINFSCLLICYEEEK